MALGTTHTNWQHGSYEADRNDQIKYSENRRLYLGNLADLDACNDNVVLGYWGIGVRSCFLPHS